MADKFDKWFPHGLSDRTVRCDYVGYTEKREQNTDTYDVHGLEHHVFSSKTWKSLVPNRCQQLLDVWMRYKLIIIYIVIITIRTFLFLFKMFEY